MTFVVCTVNRPLKLKSRIVAINGIGSSRNVPERSVANRGMGSYADFPGVIWLARNSVVWRLTSHVNSRIAEATTGQAKSGSASEPGFREWHQRRSRKAFGTLHGQVLGRRFGTAETLISGLCDLAPNLNLL
jgi:hypothetical protein